MIGLEGLFRSVAIGLCVDAVMKKSDPKAALLWVSLMTVFPALGSSLYLLFGINRFDRKRLGSGGGMFAGTVETAETLVGVETIHNAIIRAIDGAEETVDLSTYIFRSDDLGHRMAAALEAAQDRGVRVRILLDGFGNSPLWGWRRARMRGQLRRAGLNVRLFNAAIWPWTLPYLNLRNHRKICLIDNHDAFIGSANIGRVPNLETQFRLTGFCVFSLANVFETDWSDTRNTASYSRETEPNQSGWIDTLVASSPAQPVEALRLVLLDLILKARSHIRIVTPYFLPDEGLRTALLAARYKGVRVEILLPARSNYRVLDWASHSQCRSLKQAGCEIRYRTGCFDHSKLFTVDGTDAVIGSSNWDARSFRLNQEVDLVTQAPMIVQQLDQEIDRRARASDVSQRTRPKPILAFQTFRNALARLALPYL